MTRSGYLRGSGMILEEMTRICYLKRDDCGIPVV
nr:MAG TPA: hypothetical protein [Caudoviricetes sp.]